jgi:hypothetical protein
MVVGTAGTGFVGFDPLSALSGGVNGYVTTGAYGLSTITSGVSPGLAATTNNVAPYPLSNASMNVRVVGASIRLKYTGTELNRGGTVTGYAAPQGTTITTSTVDEIRGIQSAVVDSVKRDFSELTYKPYSENQLDYTNALAASGGVLPPKQTLLLMVVSGAVSQAPFDYEFHAHYEYQLGGNPTTPLLPLENATLSRPDSIGLSMVTSAMESSKSSLSSVEGVKNFISSIMDVENWPSMVSSIFNLSSSLINEGSGIVSGLITEGSQTAVKAIMGDPSTALRLMMA